jgi:NADH-quinone oxidoreductase subunit C
VSTNPPESDVREDHADPVAEFAASVSDTVGGTSWSAEHGTVKVRVETDRWAEAAEQARDAAGLRFFEFLSAIDWANDVEVGDAPEEPVEERYEVLCALTDLVEGRVAILSTDVGKDDPRVPSIEHLFPGAQWHEREAAEMFGIVFDGLTHTDNLYLPDHFEGHPLRKSFALLSREVKPWPGDVDVEDLPGAGGSGPSTENPEA